MFQKTPISLWCFFIEVFLKQYFRKPLICKKSYTFYISFYTKRTFIEKKQKKHLGSIKLFYYFSHKVFWI